MNGDRASIKMPEMLVYGKALALGFASAEVFNLAILGGNGVASLTGKLDPVFVLTVVAVLLALVVSFAWLRGATPKAARLWRSYRVDLLSSMVLGIWANDIARPFTANFHGQVTNADPLWTLLIGVFFLLLICSPILSFIKASLAQRNKGPAQLFFLTDDEIRSSNHDVLATGQQAEHFAQLLLESGSNNGLVFGIDGPWGTGKTSFINLANNYWTQNAPNEVIVFRFEPLRYASDPNLAERFIRDLSANIQSQVFVPEFGSVATRYSRMLKGKANLSFLGFQLELEPSIQTIDELLDDIDDVLKRLGRRLIVVVDDLDRLEPVAVNNVLFTVRRTCRLSQATYVLCYDTENLVANKDDGDQARQFLEKFINIKINLFVDTPSLTQFLRHDWTSDESRYPAIPADTMFKLRAVLSELADILDDKKLAHQYMPLIGDLRKVKRFINALLGMQIEKVALARTDFHNRDLINLTLLNLNYPGVFRRIFIEETSGRSGAFSLKKGDSSQRHGYANSDAYAESLAKCQGSDKFLLNQLFDVNSFDFGDYSSIEENVRATRACFNSAPHRNLEAYLNLIVRCIAPEPRATFKLYQEAVSKVTKGTLIKEIFSDPEFQLIEGEVAHDQFWRVLASQSYDLNKSAANDSICTLVKYLPKYASIGIGDRALRGRSIYTLIRLLDRAGWDRTQTQRRNNSPENVAEIADLIFGERGYAGNGLLDRLYNNERGVLGLYDAMLLRLQCSADRLGQNYNLQTALVVHGDKNARTTGDVAEIAIEGMRTLSQRIVKMFKLKYIDERRNLFDDIDALPDADYLGESSAFFKSEAKNRVSEEDLKDRISSARSNSKGFIVYQLANRQAHTGSGIGCGFYDLNGTSDAGGISTLINDYVFKVCFNPEIDSKNTEHFLDFCLRNLSSGFELGQFDEDYSATQKGIVAGLDSKSLAAYWFQHKKTLKSRGLSAINKKVATESYIASYSENLPAIFDVLDQIEAQQMSEPKMEDGAT
jgi:hypothetical protein